MTTYKDAGVDIDAGNAIAAFAKRVAGKTSGRGKRNASMGGTGVFFLDDAGYGNRTVLVLSNDGVGTVCYLAPYVEAIFTLPDGAPATAMEVLGWDAYVASANDVVVRGAQPLLALDYIATNNLTRTKDLACAAINGFGRACGEDDCLLSSGETAEMTGHFTDDSVVEVIGTVVGAVTELAMLPSPRIGSGDILLGLASSGVHVNGFSLVRRVLRERGLHINDTAPFAPGYSLGEMLLRPVRLYSKVCLPLAWNGYLKGMAHITGGGFFDKLLPVLPEGIHVHVELSLERIPPEFHWIAEAGNVPWEEMARTFNCGVGMVLVVAPQYAGEVAHALQEGGEETVIPLGELSHGERGVTIHFR